ncbi:hypothetical protein [Streptomyces brasiliensis]|uniref:hypothetical protein n=1 Tax=Streptomyces brasiliensis TaxID=1954 RepID=UPI0016707C9C
MRDRDVDLPIRIGLPGPAGVLRLLCDAARFGVGTSAFIARNHGSSPTDLMGTAGPDRSPREPAREYDHGLHGELKVDFHTFGGLHTTAQWAARFRDEPGRQIFDDRALREQPGDAVRARRVGQTGGANLVISPACSSPGRSSGT